MTEGKVFPPRSLILGSPAKAARALEEREVVGIRENTATYVGLAHKASLEYSEVEE